MTVYNGLNKIAYIGSAEQTLYPIPFEYISTDDIKVSVYASNNEFVEDWTYSIQYVIEGGNVKVLSGYNIDNAKKLLILRSVDLIQDNKYREGGDFPAKSTETSFDKLTMITQQLQETLDRCVKVEVLDIQTPEELLQTVYDKLDSATEIAGDAISAASQAQTAADNATAAVNSAEQTLVQTQAYVDSAKVEIDNSVAQAKADISTAVDEATMDISDTSTNAINTINTAVSNAENNISTIISDAEGSITNIAVTEANKAIANAAQEATDTAAANVNSYVDGTVKPELQTYVTAAAGSASSAAQSATDAATTLSEVEATASTFNTVFNNKVTDFNSNAATKTSAFDTNAATKQAAVDASAAAAAASQQAAATSETNAGVSETNAAQSALLAQTLAERVRSEGIPMSVIEQKRSETSGDTVKLWWQDPRDTIIDGFVLASWKSTTIIKKQGGYPEDIDDGEVVEIVTTRNKYLNEPLIDTQADAANWFYRAFPLSVNGVYNLDKRNCFGVVMFGYRINETDPVPSTRVEYLSFVDNYFYDPCVMDFVSDEFNWGSWRKAFFIPKPCALQYSGVVDYYLNPDNFTLKEDGTASDVSNTGYGGNFMCEFPTIFVKVYKENNYINVLFSNVKLDEDFECWSCKKADGTYAKNFYLPMFEGTNVSNVLRSVATTGKPTASLNAETEATYAMANGAGWNTTLWADELLMMLLFPLLFKSTDSQSVLGYGGSGSTTALTVNNNAAVTKGLMYGSSAGSAFGMTYLGLHNWYGHRWRRPNGLMNANGDIKVKLTTSTVDGSTVGAFNRTGVGYISTGFTLPEASQSYINRYEPIGNGKFGIVPKAVTGSSTTFYCDGMWTNNGQLDQLILGGSVYHGAPDGVFCFHVDSLPSHSNWNYGASPSYHNL